MPQVKHRPVACPTCGTPLPNPTARCVVCAPLPPSRPNGYQLCPACWHLRPASATVCPHCQAGVAADVSPKRWWGTPPDYSAVPEDFLRVFAGFFLGEGTVVILSSTNADGEHLGIRASIGLRDDDAPVLKMAHNWFPGSSLYRKGHLANAGANWKPQLFWNLNGLARNLAFLPLMQLYGSVLPCKKHKDIENGLAYIRWRISRPLRFTPDDWAVAHEFVDRLREERRYREGEA
jgi:hypothetical protein